jgi:hypothetical protein
MKVNFHPRHNDFFFFDFFFFFFWFLFALVAFFFARLQTSLMQALVFFFTIMDELQSRDKIADLLDALFVTPQVVDNTRSSRISDAIS